MNKIIENIKNRRSIRRYLDKKLPVDAVKEIIEAGKYAPSSHNSQPWRFVVITNKNKIRGLSDSIKVWFKVRIRLGRMFSMFHRRLRGLIHAAEKRVFTDKDLFFYGAPCVVLVCAKENRFSAQDCALAAQNMMLAARSIGIGSCWIGFADVVLNKKRRLMKELGAPKGTMIMATLAFGYPEKFPKSGVIRKDNAGIVKWVK